MNTEVDGGPLSCFNNFIFYLLPDLGHHFFNTGRMDTAVDHQLVQRQTGHFATHRIKPGKNDCLGRIIDNDLNAGGSFKRPDIPAFTTNDPAFDLIAFNVEDRHGILDGSLRGNPLDRFDDNFLGFLVGRKLGLIDNLVDIGHRLSLRLIFQGFHELTFCFLRR